MERLTHVSPQLPHQPKVEFLKNEVLSQNKHGIVRSLQQVNQTLTGKREGDFNSGKIELLEQIVATFLSDAVLLNGRAGMSVTLGDETSRLVLLQQQDKITIFPSEVSTDDVKSAWSSDFVGEQK